MAKRINYQLLRDHRFYTTKELAEELEVSRSAVKYWVGQGLQPINPDERTWIFYGADVKEFLRRKSEKSKVETGPGEVFCVGCRKGRRLKPETIRLEFTGKLLGKSKTEQIRIHSVGTCNHKIVTLSSVNRIEELFPFYPILRKILDSSSN